MRRERRQKRQQAEPAADLVKMVLHRYGVSGAVREHRLVTDWTTIVGERIAARSWPDGLKSGVLYVRVSNSAWLQELSFLREAMIESANRAVGMPPLVRDVRLHLGARRGGSDEDDLLAALATRRKPVKPTPKPRVPPDAATLRAIEEDSSKVSDTELREIIRTVRKKVGL